MAVKRKGRPPKLIVSVSRRIEEDWIIRKAFGDKLPTQAELAKQYEVDRTTIRTVLERLERDKKIIRKYAGGAIVAGSKDARHARFAGIQIGLSFADVNEVGTNSFLNSIHTGIIEELGLTGADILFCTRRWRATGAEKAAQHFNLPSVRGLLLIARHRPAVVKAFKQLGKPMVAVDFDATAQGIDSFCFDDFQAGELLARRLAKFGHRRTAAIFESTNKPAEKSDQSWAHRREGFTSALEKLGLPPPAIIELPQRVYREEYRQRTREILCWPKAKRPTAFFVLSTGHFEPVWRMAEASGLRVPKDLTIVGCGQTKEDEMTGVRFNGDDMGRSAAEYMLRLIQSKKPIPESRKATKKTIKGYYIAGRTHAKAPSMLP